MLCRECKKEIPDNSLFCNFCGAKQDASKTPSKRRRSNGEGTIIKEANGTYTIVRRAVIGGRTRVKKKRGFERKKDAIAYLPKLVFEPDPVEERKITLEDLYVEWSRLHFEKISDSKRTAYKIAYKKLCKLYGRIWSGITLREMQEVVNEQPSYYTKRDVKQVLSLLGEFALKNEWCDRNRGKLIELPPLDTKEKEAFSVEEVGKLWDDYNAGNDFTGYALIMIYTGMRFGELADVLIENVHLDEGYLTGGKKTEAGKNRPIVLAECIRPIVRKYAERNRRKLVQMHPDTFRAQFDEMTARAGVRPLKPHSCRHTFCSMLALAGVQPGIIQKVAGHTNYSTTAQYTHLQSLSDGLSAIEKMGSFLNESRGEKGVSEGENGSRVVPAS